MSDMIPADPKPSRWRYKRWTLDQWTRWLTKENKPVDPKLPSVCSEVVDRIWPEVERLLTIADPEEVWNRSLPASLLLLERATRYGKAGESGSELNPTLRGLEDWLQGRWSLDQGWWPFS